MKNRKPAIHFDASGEIWLWVAKHRAYLPWKMDDALAEYLTDDGKQSFDSIEKIMKCQ